MNSPDTLEERMLVWRSTKMFLISVVIILAVVIIGWTFRGHVTLWQWFVPFVLSIGFLILVYTSRPFSVIINSSIFFISFATVIIGSTITNLQLLHSGVNYQAFLGYKIGALYIALFAPRPIILGYVLIGFCGIASFFHFFLLPSELQGLLPVQEPWVSMVYVAVSFLILFYRIKNSSLEKTLFQLKAENKASLELARVFLALRDLTNTPLQTIELTTSLLEAEEISKKEGAFHLSRAMLRLRELSMLLASFEKSNNLASVELERSFDSVRYLEAKLAKMQK